MPPARRLPTGPALAAAALFLVGSCGGSGDPSPATPAPQARSFSTEALGVRLRIQLVPGPADPTAAVEAAFDEARRLEDLVNLWSEDSALARWNIESRATAAGPLALDPELAELLAPALEVALDSGGALDPTVAPALRELGFYGQEPAAELDEAARASWRRRVGHGALELDGALLRRELPAMELDLSALAKGVAADRMARVLREAAVPTALVEAGSSVVAFGSGPGGPGGSGWPLTVPRPEGPRTLFLLDEAASTSGASSLTLTGPHAGHSHLLDPRSLAPVDHRTEMVVVRGPDGTTCDLWSTALLVMGLDELEAWWPTRPASARRLAATVYAAPLAEGDPPDIVELPR